LAPFFYRHRTTEEPGTGRKQKTASHPSGASTGFARHVQKVDNSLAALSAKPHGSYIARAHPGNHMDETQLVTALVAGAAIASKQLVHEATKDAYKGLKQLVRKIFGSRAERAIEGVERAPVDSAAVQKLTAAIPEIDAHDVAELEVKTTALLKALRADPHALQLITAAHMKLDVDAGGNVILERLSGADVMDVKAKAGGDFTMRDIGMGREKPGGN
jgi:hypothetical protein